MPMLFLPHYCETLFVWGERDLPPSLATIERFGQRSSLTVVTPDGTRDVRGARLPLVETAAAMAAIPASELAGLPDSVAVWVQASKLGLELVARERIVPTIWPHGSDHQARWSVALSDPEDASRVAALARSMPPAAHALITGSSEPAPVWASPEAADANIVPSVWPAEALLREFLHALADALVRRAYASTQSAVEKPVRRRSTAVKPVGTWPQRWIAALRETDVRFVTAGFAERSVAQALDAWSEPVVGSGGRLRACFRLDLPEADNGDFQLVFLLQSPDDPSLLVSASEVWGSHGGSLERFGLAFREPQNTLLAALGRAAALYPPILSALQLRRPEFLELTAEQAWEFLGEVAPLLAEAGFGVIVPGELTAAGQRRLRLRMRIGDKVKVAGMVAGTAGLEMDQLLAVNWEAVVGDDPLKLAELNTLARQKAPLVQFRGQWVAVDPNELADIRRRIRSGPSPVTRRQAMQMALAGESQAGSLRVDVIAQDSFAEFLQRLRQASATTLTAPAALAATLRPYQERGLNWLVSMSKLGLGACLADDMGLGKTMQLLAYMLWRQQHAPEDARPALLVAPTSVIGNWERETQRFAPSLSVFPHYGSGRAQRAEDLPRLAGTILLTSFGLLRRDAELLAAIDWSVVVLDEAQNIKNSASATARAARRLKASQRFALTGTPVENRLAELWSILEFANPGLLGPIERFHREFATPIERYGDAAAAARLRQIVGPFILRRLKSDPTIISDLPAKLEMKVICTLTREQASLYKAVVDAELLAISQTEGIARRGMVLALLTRTKQICNHPAQYLAESGPLSKRSGKLERTREMLEEAIAAGDKALVFTQFREMGEHLVTHLQSSLGVEVCFLHGGIAKKKRDQMVQRFQDDAHGPRIFVLSVKAGGTGLNLTAANHVFHFDRWWNPAVEDQASDRAYRIGQKRNVQVHKLICAGTVEEKIDAMLTRKRELADQVVGSGERWITELGSAELRELFALTDRSEGIDDEVDADVGASPPTRSPQSKPRGPARALKS